MVNKTTFAGIFLLVMFFLYNYLLFEMLDRFLSKPRIKKLSRLPLLACNVAIVFFLGILSNSSSLVIYLIITIILFIELNILYTDRLLSKLFCVSAVIMHIMTIRSLFTSIFALATHHTIYEIANNSFLLILSLACALLFLNLCVAGVIKFIPATQVKIIMQHNEQFWFMSAWITVFNLYLITNASVYSEPKDHPMLPVNQIIAPLAILTGLYIVLFFTIKTATLLGYKEKTEELQEKIRNEHQYRDVLTSMSLANFEFNLTTNEFVSGMESYRKSLGKLVSRNYQSVIRILIHKLVYSEDIDRCKDFYSAKYLLQQFKDGNRELVSEYRRRQQENGEYIWVRATVNLVQDDLTTHIKGFTYVKNIDAEKKRQIELMTKAERDSLTGIYNKGTTATLISQYLDDKDNTEGTLFIIDVDNFKSVNDNFGHTYGDAVLCELAEKLHAVFRENDIVGRIGGDEFMAFMKKTTDHNILLSKAEEISKAFYSVYNNDHAYFVVSSSIGIARFPFDGTTFAELYKNADSALYAAKKTGKNTFSLYESGLSANPKNNWTDSEPATGLPRKNFKQNKLEYIFKILYDNEKPLPSIKSVLELVTSHFNFDRSYFFEIDNNKQTVSNLFECCADNVESFADAIQNLTLPELPDCIKSLANKRVCIITNTDFLSKSEYAMFAARKIQKMILFGIFDKNDFLGFIGFDKGKNDQGQSKVEIDELTTICNLISLFYVKNRLNTK